MVHFLKYNAIGLLNTAITLVAVYFFYHRLGMNLVAANALGYVAGACNSFWMNRVWNFRSQGKVHGEALRFVTVFAACYLLNLGVLLAANWAIAQWDGLRPFWIAVEAWLKPGFVAHTIANVVYVVASFGLMKLWVFRQPEQP